MKTTTNDIGVVNTQLSRIHILLHKINKTAYKVDYVIDITNGRETSTTKLTHAEANKLIEMLEQEHKKQYAQPINAGDRMRKKIISCCIKFGMTINGKADMKAIYTWVLKYGYLHKPLNSYTEQELPKLVTQAENMKSSTE